MQFGQRGAICAGMYSSASTWVYNVVLELFDREAVPLYFDDVEMFALSEDLKEIVRRRGFVLKTHRPDEELREFICKTSYPLILSVRDPRDAVASLMKRFDRSFEYALTYVASSAEALPLLCRHRRPVILMYEKGYTASGRTIEVLAAQLKLSPSPDKIKTIGQVLSPYNVRQQLEVWQRRGIFDLESGPDAFDPQTHWHPNHVGDGRSGKWREVLSPDQAEAVILATREYCKSFGYSA
jgi:hypothetical protein